jgi:toxin ParE1/3/4
MSSRKAQPLPLKLAPRARQDFIDILRYTGETWGESQLEIYRDKIDAALQKISLDPECGHQRDDLPATRLGYLVGSHIIIYRLNPDSVGVVRILHQRMALIRHI